MNALSQQIGGDHYKKLAIQPAEFSERNGLSFLEGCIIKRICRHPHKGGREDLLKARHEIDLLIALRYPTTLEPHSPPNSLKKAKKAR